MTDERPWCFTFVGGPFDGYRIDAVPIDEVAPDEDPPAELLLWQDERMHVYSPDEVSDDQEAERYQLLDADLREKTAVYEWDAMLETGAALAGAKATA